MTIARGKNKGNAEGKKRWIRERKERDQKTKRTC